MFNLFGKKNKGKGVIFKIEGMHCSSCAMNIDGVLEELPEVVEVRTSYAKAETWVVGESGGVDEKKLIRAIKKAGYKAVRSG